MTLRLFIDECLSPKLVAMANEAGYECTCSRDRGLLAATDWRLVVYVIQGEFTLVTNNAVDFRGHHLSHPGGLYSLQEIHPGLICLNSPFPMTLKRQRHLFRHALAELHTYADLINHALEISEAQNGTISSILYEIPRPDC